MPATSAAHPSARSANHLTVSAASVSTESVRSSPAGPLTSIPASPAVSSLSQFKNAGLSRLDRVTHEVEPCDCLDVRPVQREVQRQQQPGVSFSSRGHTSRPSIRSSTKPRNAASASVLDTKSGGTP